MVVRDINTQVVVTNINPQIKYRYLKQLVNYSQKVLVLTCQSISTTSIYTHMYCTYLYVLYIYYMYQNIKNCEWILCFTVHYCIVPCSCDVCNFNLPSYQVNLVKWSDLPKIGLKKMFSVKKNLRDKMGCSSRRFILHMQNKTLIKCRS